VKKHRAKKHAVETSVKKHTQKHRLKKQTVEEAGKLIREHGYEG